MGGFKTDKQQKVDHGGNFYMMPRRVTGSVAWRHLTFRARAILDAFLHAFDGHNNGRLIFSIHAIGKAIGSKNHGLNSKAVAELIELGFLECVSDANRAQSKAREYRITFIATHQSNGNGVEIVPATHEYIDWRPLHARKFGGGRTTTTKAESSSVTTTTVKGCVGETTSDATESCGLEGLSLVGETTPLLCTIPPGSQDLSKSPEIVPQMHAGDFRTELGTLRVWARKVVADIGYGGNRTLADAAGISEVALSRFRSGKNLPDQYRAPLQHACARHIPFKELAA
jgi:hypothetical protein